jgi:DNA ligase-1
MKPLLAEDYVESKLVFPLGVQPKIDGVRGLTTEGHLTGRSLKKHKNKYTTAFYSIPEYAHLDGELAANDERHPNLCRLTSSALSTIKGEPFTLWHVFDCLRKEILHAPYVERYKYLEQYVHYEQSQGRCMHAKTVPMKIVSSLEELNAADTEYLELGYEGTIIRGLQANHKEGRSTVLQGQLLRIKQFIEAEALVVAIEEGDVNENVAQTNELGRTFRSSHQDNKVPNGMVGNLQCRLIKDIVYEGKVLFAADTIITVSPGNMDHKMRKHYFENQGEIVQHVIKFKFFPKGIKDKPRFPTYVCHRSAEDQSE